MDHKIQVTRMQHGWCTRWLGQDRGLAVVDHHLGWNRMEVFEGVLMAGQKVFLGLSQGKLDIDPAAETRGLAAPETSTGGTALTGTQERTGSPSTAGGAIPAEEGLGPSRSAASSSSPKSPGLTEEDGLLLRMVCCRLRGFSL